MSGLLVSIMGAASDAVGSLTGMTKKAEKPAETGDSVQATFSALLAGALNPKSPTVIATPKTAGTSELATGEATEDEGGAAADASAGAKTAAAPEAQAKALIGIATADLPVLGAPEVALASAAPAVAAATKNGAAVEASEKPVALSAMDATTRVAPTAATEPVDPTAVQTSLVSLDPQFRERLERVVSRMKTEYGHEVRITETMRDQSRQNFLFGQGRTRPGPVVTWTRSSNHTVGRAADLMIDGTYNNPTGYEHLAKIAAEEGLRTLGPRDPGHVELPGGNRRSVPAFAPEPAQSLPIEVAQPREFAQPGRVAQVAQVAQVARVAEVARVARPGSTPTSVPVPVPVAQVAIEPGTDSGQEQSASQNNPGFAEARPEIVRLDGPAAPRATYSSTAAEALTSAAGLDASSRVAQIAQLQDTAGTGPLNQILLKLDNAAGGEDRIRVDLRGLQVGASMDMASAADADRLTSRISELQRALENRGLEPELLKVRSSTPRDAAELIRMSNTALELEAQRSNLGSRNSGSDPSTRDRWESLAQEKSRRESDDPRGENRRNPKQEKK